MSVCLKWALIAISLTTIRRVNSEKDEACETLPSEIHIIKEEFDELGRLQRTCNADIAVNKCEGACNSQVQPSVITPNGFLKVDIMFKPYAHRPSPSNTKKCIQILGYLH